MSDDELAQIGAELSKFGQELIEENEKEWDAVAREYRDSADRRAPVPSAILLRRLEALLDETFDVLISLADYWEIWEDSSRLKASPKEGYEVVRFTNDQRLLFRFGIT
ncbi:MAG: hypothetical protein ACREMY_24105, partial [bacterium]